MPPSIKAEWVKGFSLYAMRAIMSGRGDEIVALVAASVLR